MKRWRIIFNGIVQGVGFRPFIYRNAVSLNLKGFVRNSSRGVVVEVEGEDSQLKKFIEIILKNPPPISSIEEYRIEEIEVRNSKDFKILHSEKEETTNILVSPDIGICEDCKRELFNPSDRRFMYPFINCTNCGPRFTIIEDLPYDRVRTTMKKFEMCEECREEYEDPLNRRYHAQPISCYDCGPSLSVISHDGKMEVADPISFIAEELKRGRIVSIKGLGGYHLACSPFDDSVVMRLRDLKSRETKPFALMGTLSMIEEFCYVSEDEKKILLSPSAPIVLLRKKRGKRISKFVAPEQNYLGFMIPYTPLHLLILEKVKFPLIMTSANMKDQTIIYRDNYEELLKMSDFILTHDRDIHIFVDDSVVQVVNRNLYTIRRSRGYVPLPFEIPLNSKKTVLGIGGAMKTTFTFLKDNRAIMGQHIGDTYTLQSIEEERRAIKHFMKLFSLYPDTVVVDMHPDYPNRIIVDEFKDSRVIEVQHHKAHLASLMGENGYTGSIIGIVMDGTGYGEDGTIWGGEFFMADGENIRRVGHIKNFFLSGGDMSIKEPWRALLSLLYEVFKDDTPLIRFVEKYGEKGYMVLNSIKRRTGGVMTSSCGRVFDAVAVLLGLGDRNTYEGELPMKLQYYAENSSKPGVSYPFNIEEKDGFYILNMEPAILAIMEDGRGREDRAFIFHNTLSRAFLELSLILREKYHIDTVGFSGGVFQNRLLLELLTELMEREKFNILLHSRVPPNDGGISLGQAFIGASQ